MDRPSKLFTKNSPWAIVFCRGTMNSVTEEQSKLGCLVPGYFSGFSNMCKIGLSSTVRQAFNAPGSRLARGIHSSLFVNTASDVEKKFL
jgi:hypothetical protein